MRAYRAVIAALFFVCASAPAFAQEWTEYKSLKDRFTVNLPGQPTVQEITWPSEYGAVFPGRVYSLTQGRNKYSMTVIDYTESERRHAERTNHTDADSGNMYWRIDIQASVAYAATKFRQRPGVKVTFDAYHYIDLVSGHQLQLTNPDESRTFVGIYLHENRLYILEATVPPRAPQPGLFQQSVGFLDEKGDHVRYREIYFNKLPPVRTNRDGLPGGGQGEGRQGEGRQGGPAGQ
jgi:hypothetical protein